MLFDATAGPRRRSAGRCVPDSFALPARPQSTPQSLDVVLAVHYTSTYMSTGSPTPSISGMTHFRSNAFASTILNIFWTLIDADVEQNINEACIAFAKRFAYVERAQGGAYKPTAEGWAA